VYSQIVKNIMFPIYQFNHPFYERYTTYINLLEKTQWWDYQKLEELQLKNLKNLLQHANDNVPYYHRIFKKLNFKPEFVRSIRDLNVLPILTKDLIKKNFNELYARNYREKQFFISSTGGSTSAPLKFYIDNRWEACNMAAAYRSSTWAGYKLGDKMAYLWSAPQDIHDTAAIEKIRQNLLKIIYLDAFNLTEENMHKYIDTLKRFKPKIINTYASAIFTFSAYIKKMGVNTIKPKAILTTADMLYNYKRKAIENTFNCEVFDYYSGRETTLQAAECQEHFGYHLSIENAVVEFMKEKEHVNSGETGSIIITDLCNYAMPFIRYEIGDLGTPSNERCPCGRQLPVMKSLKGRTCDYIITSDGKLLPGIFFHHLIAHDNIQGIKEFQIVQKTKDKIIVYIVKEEDEKKENISLFLSQIKRNVGETIDVELIYVDSLRKTSTGKLKNVISKINPLDIVSDKYDFDNERF